MRILIVEDEIKLAEALAQILMRNTMAADIAGDGEYGLDCIRSGIYDAVILDVMLPKLDGLSVLRTIRAEKNAVPVLLLTARDEVADKVRGLDAGADDYLTKPFSTDELLARLRALSRRNPELLPDDTLSFADIVLDRSTCELACGSHKILLSMKEVMIMELLIRNGNRILPKEMLLVKVWGYDTDAAYNNVEVYISFLRKKLLCLDSKVQIRTLRGAGYRLEVHSGEDIRP